MFVIDAFIGNWGRHNGNWEFLYTHKNDHMEIAPIFDCGSVLFPQIDDELIKKVILSKAKMNARVYDVPTSANLIDAKEANYDKAISSKQFDDCTNALKRILPRIDLSGINKLIDSVEHLSQMQKKFLKRILKLRKGIMLMIYLNRLIKRHSTS